MQAAGTVNADLVPTLQAQRRELRRELARLDREIAGEREELARLEGRLAALAAVRQQAA
jgi:hypothetical protein